MGRLNGRTTLITGGSRGFGRAIALAYAREGADVAITYRAQKEPANEVVEEVKSLGRRAFAIQADVRDEEQVRQMTVQARRDLGRIDILVNNAGVMTIGPFLEQSVDAWRDMIDTNILGVLFCCKHVLPVMIEQQYGKIVMLSSQVARAAMANFAVYSATKAAVIGLTQALAKEYGPHNININAIGPGSIETDMSRHVFSEEAKKRRIAELPVRRMGTVEDVAHTAVFLASEESSFYAGQVFYPNGGLIM